MTETPYAVEVEGVWVSFRGATVLEDVSLRLPRGEFLGLIGPNGGGKSVFLKVLLGLIRPDRGQVRILGGPPRKARGRVGYVPQAAAFDLSFPITVLDIALMGRLGPGKVARRLEPRDHQHALDALEKVGMSGQAHRQIGKLSGGQLQRALIARALAADASILLLDEPTASLDSPIASRLYELLASLAPDCTRILVSHDIGVMHRHIQSVACLNRKLYFHDSNELTREMVEEAYGCPVDFIVHPHVHRVLPEHPG